MVRPRQPIRRFDVFAESHRLERMQQGRPADEAKGYGLWLAKVVAARKLAQGKTPQDLDRLYSEEAQTCTSAEAPARPFRLVLERASPSEHPEPGQDQLDRTVRGPGGPSISVGIPANCLTNLLPISTTWSRSF